MDPSGGPGGPGMGYNEYHQQQQQLQPMMMHQQQTQNQFPPPPAPSAFAGGLPQAGQGRPGRAFDRHDPAFYKTRMCTQVSGEKDRKERASFFVCLKTRPRPLNLDLSSLLSPPPLPPRRLLHSSTTSPKTQPVPGRHLHLRRALHLRPQPGGAPPPRGRVEDERRDRGRRRLGCPYLADLLPVELERRVPLRVEVRVRAHPASRGTCGRRRRWGSGEKFCFSSA